MNLSIDLSKISMIAISGNSGSGKSFFLNYIIHCINNFSDVIIIDPKLDEPTRIANKLGITCLNPNRNRTSDDYIQNINVELSKAVKIIYERQEALLKNPCLIYRPLYIVIDELVALKQSASKKVSDDFDALINTIALMGRSASVRLILSAQAFSTADSISSGARSQIGMSVQLGKMTSSSLQYLFPDLSSSGADGIVIPSGKGSGIIQIFDNIHPSNVLPILTPTY